jgi:hypothetical protein
VARHPFPGPGQGGDDEPPVPGVPARDGADDDDAYPGWLADIDAGRAEIPPDEPPPSGLEAAGRHPRTRWCVTVVGKDGEAVAHGCARGQHPWTPPARSRDGPASAPPEPDEHQRAQLAGFLRQLHITLTPIARGTCDHAQREDRYIPSRKLKHLVRARTATCPAPGCNAQAIYNEIDHTTPWPAGATDECDLSPPCSRHHHAKHAPEGSSSSPSQASCTGPRQRPQLHHHTHPVRRISGWAHKESLI